jgi:hypothetical protein
MVSHQLSSALSLSLIKLYSTVLSQGATFFYENSANLLIIINISTNKLKVLAEQNLS